MLQFFSKKKNKGFTLIELLVVIAIIGLLASVILVALTNSRKKARDAKRQTELRQIFTAMQLYYDNSQSFPISSVAAGAAVPATVKTDLVSYLSIFPKDTGNPNSCLTDEYCWGGPNLTGQNFCIYARKENPSTQYIAANQKGIGITTTAPTVANGCW